MDAKTVASVVKAAMKSGKVVLGQRASLRALKSSKVVVVSSALSEGELAAAEEACKAAEVPLVLFNDSAVSLGVAAGRAFPVKMLSIKSAGDADLSKLLAAGTADAPQEQKA